MAFYLSTASQQKIVGAYFPTEAESALVHLLLTLPVDILMLIGNHSFAHWL